MPKNPTREVPEAGGHNTLTALAGSARVNAGMLAAILVFLFAVQLDWLCGGHVQQNLLGELQTMKFETAAMLAVAAIGILARVLAPARPWPPLVCGALILFACLLLPQVADEAASALLLPASPATAFMCAMLSTPLILGSRRRLPVQVGEAAACVAGMVGLAGIFGYAMGSDNLYQFEPYASMSPHTATIGMALAVAALIADPARPWAGLLDDTGGAGRTARFLLPAVLLPSLTFALLLRFNAELGFIVPALDIAFVLTASAVLTTFGAVFICLNLQRNEAELAATTARLRESDELTRQYLDAAPNALLAVAPDGAIVWANAQAHLLFRAEPGRLVGTSIERLVPQETRAEHAGLRRAFQRESMQRQMAAGKDLQALRLDGTAFPANIGLSPVSTVDGELVVVAVVDVTRHIESERTLAEQARKLEASNRELELFATIAAHDLQEPLRAVRGFGERIAGKYGNTLDERGQTWLSYVTEGGERMQQLVQDLLRHSRARTRELQRSRVDLNRVMEAIMRDLEDTIVDTNSVITSDELPTVDADAGQIQQVLQNLIVNAIKYRGEEPPQIRVAAGREGHAWVITVSDNGIGIEPRFYDRIFMPFKRLHNERNIDGTGIGLAICRTIIERHGGRIWLSPGAGQGTQFHFTLPCRVESPRQNIEQDAKSNP